MTFRALVAVAVLGPGACSGNGPHEPGGPTPSVVVDGISYSAETLVLESYPVQLRTVVRLTNTGSARADAMFPDGCVVLIRAYRDERRTGELAWDQAGAVACTMAIVQVSLAPGETREFASMTNAREVLGSSLPNGRYYLSAVLRPSGRRIEVAAGAADLAR